MARRSDWRPRGLQTLRRRTDRNAELPREERQLERGVVERLARGLPPTCPDFAS